MAVNQIPCAFCPLAATNLLKIGTEEYWGAVYVCAGYLRAIDSDYPGLVSDVEISFCPKCGRELHVEVTA
jgi:hypothetical protein